MSRIRAATGSIWPAALAHAGFDVFSTLDLWLFRLGDRWPPGAFVHRATTLVGLGLIALLILRPMIFRLLRSVDQLKVPAWPTRSTRGRR